MAERTATIKWLDETGWNAWIDDDHITSFGITAITDRIASRFPGDVEWELKGDKLICRASTKIGKMSKKDNDSK